jgi:hypothetical protein
MRTAWYRRPNAKESPTQELHPDLILSTLTGAAPALMATTLRA